MLEEKKDLPLISIVIPAYKAEKQIARAIDSVLSQEGVAVEVIVVEDGRFDNTCQIVQQYDDRVKLIALQKKHGACFARNKGLERASGDYVMFLDADDYVYGKLLSGLYKALLKSGAAIGFAPCVKKANNKSANSAFTPPANEKPDDVIVRWISGKSGPGTCSILWRRKDVIRIGGWNESYGRNQDGELIIRAMFKNCTVVRSLEGYGVYWHHEGERVSRRFTPKAFESFEMLEDYIMTQLEKTSLNRKRIIRALNYYRANISAFAYTSNLEKIGAAWGKKWDQSTPKLFDFRFIGFNTILLHFSYLLFGIKGGQKVRNLRRRLLQKIKLNTSVKQKNRR